MLGAYGWVIIQSSEAGYLSVDPASHEADILDEALEAADKVLYKELLGWLHSQNSIKWQFTEQSNNHRGILQFHASSNHRGTLIWDLLDFIRFQSSGSYGVIYVHDDEDTSGRTTNDFSTSFRVWRILDGHLSEHDDALFSPFKSKNAFGGMVPD